MPNSSYLAPKMPNGNPSKLANAHLVEFYMLHNTIQICEKK